MKQPTIDEALKHEWLDRIRKARLIEIRRIGGSAEPWTIMLDGKSGPWFDLERNAQDFLRLATTMLEMEQIARRKQAPDPNRADGDLPEVIAGTGLTLTRDDDLSEDIVFHLSDEKERLRISPDGFYVDGVKVEENDDKARKVYDAFKRWYNGTILLPLCLRPSSPEAPAKEPNEPSDPETPPDALYVGHPQAMDFRVFLDGKLQPYCIWADRARGHAEVLLFDESPQPWEMSPEEVREREVREQVDPCSPSPRMPMMRKDQVLTTILHGVVEFRKQGSIPVPDAQVSEDIPEILHIDHPQAMDFYVCLDGRPLPLCLKANRVVGWAIVPMAQEISPEELDQYQTAIREGKNQTLLTKILYGHVEFRRQGTRGCFQITKLDESMDRNSSPKLPGL